MLHLYFMLSSSFLAWGINAPWIHVNSLIKASIGADPCAVVGDYDDTTATITVNVCDADKAQAMALVLRSNFQVGRTIALVVQDPNGNVVTPTSDPGEDAEALVESSLHRALAHNRYFKTVVSGKGFYPLFVEFHPKVIQFWDDNQADVNGNSTYTAQEVFAQVLNPNFFNRVRVGMSTAR